MRSSLHTLIEPASHHRGSANWPSVSYGFSRAHVAQQPGAAQHLAHRHADRGHLPPASDHRIRLHSAESVRVTGPSCLPAGRCSSVHGTEWPRTDCQGSWKSNRRWTNRPAQKRSSLPYDASIGERPPHLVMRLAKRRSLLARFLRLPSDRACYSGWGAESAGEYFA